VSGPQARSGHFQKEKNLLPLLWFELWTSRSQATQYTDYNTPDKTAWSSRCYERAASHYSRKFSVQSPHLKFLPAHQ
jgi:hypothetical protein